ncbi:unnamed protein product [Durusdinium trenchii]|uniref:Uncharacterized protein n=2 Tax=Durusdinium trenchii TaxID=1381693 RepID=A0ABP0KXE1_9DINO
MALSLSTSFDLPSRKELQNLTAALDRWEAARSILARNPESTLHWQNSLNNIDPPYWRDFLHSTDDLKASLSKALQPEHPPDLQRSVFIVADRLIGRSRFAGSREWYVSNNKYIINEREFAALQKLLVCTLRPASFPCLTRVDEDRAVQFSSPACSFPLYISATVAEHNRFRTSRERMLYPCDFLAYPLPDQTFYQKHRVIVPWVLPNGVIEVCQGLHLCVTVESPGARAASHPFGRPVNPRSLLSKRFPAFTEEDLMRYTQKTERFEQVAFIGKNMGCLDSQKPYSESANVVMVHDPEAIEQILQVSDDLGLGLRTDAMHLGRSVAFPFSFPPALCDEEWLLQQTLLQIGSVFATDSAAQDFAVATLHQHGLSPEFLPDVSEKDFSRCLQFESEEDEVLSRARELLGKAMEHLRRIEVMKRWISEELLGKELLERLWQELKLKKEWAEVEDRWNQCAPTRKSKNKKARQKDKQERAEVIDPQSVYEQLQQAVADMNKKIWKNRTYHKYFCLLQRRGVLDYFDRCLCDGARAVLHGPGLRSVSFSPPHGGSKPDGRPPKIGL